MSDSFISMLNKSVYTPKRNNPSNSLQQNVMNKQDKGKRVKQQVRLPILQKPKRQSPKSIIHNREMSELYKQQLLHRDKDKNPLKYKIINEFIGMEDERVYSLKKEEVNHIQSQYLKQKGRQNLKQAGKLSKRSLSCRSPNFNSFIHQIFGKQHIQKEIRRSNKSLNPQRQLKERQHQIGKFLLKKVEKYLKEDKEGSFPKRILTISAIDSALADHIKVKIRRAESQLS